MAALLAAALLSGCGRERSALRVRTDLPTGLRDDVEAGFEATHPDIDVRFSDGSPEESLSQLRSGEEASFDVWWGVPALTLARAASDGLVEEWRPVLQSPFVVAFDRTVVPLTDAPRDWIDVLHYAWYDEVRLADPATTEEGAYFVGSMLVQALRDRDDLERGFDWLGRLDEQVDLYASGSEELVRALERRDALLVIMPRADAERARTGEAPWLHYRVPTSGTPVLTLGAALVAGTTAVEASRAFIDHLQSPEAATAAELRTHWQPVDAPVDGSALPPDFELEARWTGYPLALDTLEAELDGWIDRWDREVRGR